MTKYLYIDRVNTSIVIKTLFTFGFKSVSYFLISLSRSFVSFRDNYEIERSGFDKIIILKTFKYDKLTHTIGSVKQNGLRPMKFALWKIKFYKIVCFALMSFISLIGSSLRPSPDERHKCDGQCMSQSINRYR